MGGEAAALGCLQLTSRLVEGRANIEIRSHMNRTPLLLAVSGLRANNLAHAEAHAHVEVVRYLLEARADALAIDDSGDTLLHIAKRRGWHEGMEWLRVLVRIQGGDPEKPNH